MDNPIQATPRRQLDFSQEENHIDLSVEDGTIEALHSRVPEEEIPKIGMEFQSEDAAYIFYNAYAMRVGFSVRKCSVHKYKGNLLDRRFVCSCQGKRGSDKRENVYNAQRAETRFGCSAMFKICFRQTGRPRVVKFNANHNHNMASPSKTHLFRSHRKISLSQAAEVDLADISGIPTKNAYEFMARQAGGRENLGFSKVDYRNYLQSKRTRDMDPRETGGILEYLQGMKVEDPSFFYAIQVDEDALITNIFWADAKMMADYEDFGDVVCFDTTYRKHKDGRPIALFVGVNHHKQSTIFGAALLYDETADTFVWLFETFSRAMSGKLPKTMLTDQDAAMSKALAFQWPATYHRLCIWHIFQNAASHLHDVFSSYKDFAKDFSSCIYDFEYEDDFLDAWKNMLDKYGKQDNDWLKRLFSIKEKWALVYGRETFCADMTTTQRSESMNSLIKKYVSPKQDLRRFFANFQRLLDDRRYDEMVLDFKCSHSRVSLTFSVDILEQAASVYTPTVFKLFQKELQASYDSRIEVCGEVEGIVKYKVTPSKKSYSFIVSYGCIEEKTWCNCRKFEFAGLICSHILRVFYSRGILKIPNQYILKRWTKDAKKGSITATNYKSDAEVDPKSELAMRYKELCRLSTRLVTRAAESENGFNFIREVLLNSSKELNSVLVEKSATSSLPNYRQSGTELTSDMPSSMDGSSKKITGLKLKPKSRAQSSLRPKSALEIATKRKRKSKKVIDANQQLEQHAVLSQANQSVQVNEIGAQQRLSSTYPQEQFGYYGATSLGLGNMYMNSLHVHPNQLHSHQYFQPSYMTLLTSLEAPSSDDGQIAMQGTG